MTSCRRVWLVLMIACFVLVIFLTEFYSLALLKWLSIPLISASAGLGVAFLPELGGSCQRAALRPFLNLLSRLGRDCPQSCEPKHHMRPSRIRWVPAFGGSTQEHQLNFHGWLQGPRSTNSFAKTLASPMDAWPPQCRHELLKWSGYIASPGLFWSTSNSTSRLREDIWIAPIAANGIGRIHLLITSRTRIPMRHTSPD